MFGCHRVTTTSSRDAPPTAALTPRENMKRADQWIRSALLFCNLWFPSFSCFLPLMAPNRHVPQSILLCPNTAPWCLVPPPCLCSHFLCVFFLLIWLLGSVFISSSFPPLSEWPSSAVLSPLSLPSPPLPCRSLFSSLVKGQREVRVQGEVTVSSLQPMTDHFLLRPERSVCLCVCSKESILRNN